MCAMTESKGIIFSIEAVAAAAIFLAVVLVTLYSSQLVSTPNNDFYNSMTVAHDMVYANASEPPTGYVNNLDWCNSTKHYVARISVTDYNNWHAEVCVK
jgi:hypothetical protein